MIKKEIQDFWSMITTDDIDIRAEGELKWQEFSNNNPGYFETMKCKFTEQFYNVYRNMNFHDFQIDRIVSDCGDFSKESQIKVLLFDYHEDYGKDLYVQITYHHVNEYMINVKPTRSHLTWDSDIFENLNNGMIKHRVQCHDGAYIVITFKSISIDKLINHKKNH